MRTISADLLNAALSLRARPYVAASVANKRPRWSSVRYGDGSALHTAQVALGAVIWRARVDSSGNVQTAKVTSPTTSAQWITWTTRATGVVASSDVAISTDGTTRLRLFYYTAGYNINVVESSDSGDTWTSPSSIVSGLPSSPSLAACATELYYTTAATLAVYSKPWASGAWTVGAAWTAAPVPTAWYGIAAADRGDGTTSILAAINGIVTLGSYTPATTTWGTFAQIAPGGTHGAPTAGLTLRYPAALWANRLLYITWDECFSSGPLTWNTPIVLRSTDAIHLGDEVPLYIWASTERRAALCYLAAARTLYAANEKCVCAAKLYAADDATQNLQLGNVLTFTRSTSEHGSRVHLEILNPDHVYSQPGRAGKTAEPLQALAELSISRGYYTSGSAHAQEALDPHYIVSARIVPTTIKAGALIARANVPTPQLILDAVDGWGLLELYRPTETRAYTSKAVRWLLAEACATVGLGYSDAGTSGLGYSVPTFTWLPSQSAADVARALLRLAGAVARWTEAGALYAIELYGYSPSSAVNLGEANEVLASSYAIQPHSATSWRVFGDGCAAAAAALGLEALTLGLRIHRQQQDYRLSTQAQADKVQSYWWTRGRISNILDTLSVPLRPDAELWDTAHEHVDPSLVPTSDLIRRVIAIAEEYEPRRAIYTSTLTLQDV